MHAPKSLVRAVAATTVATIGLAAAATAAHADGAVAPSFALDVPGAIHAGAAAAPFTGTLVSNDGATNVWVKTEITGAAADDVQVEWKNGSQWLPMPDTEPQTPGLQLTFGDGDLDQDGKGFTVPAGITNVTDFRITAAKSTLGGDLAWTSELVTGDAGTPVQETSGHLTVTPSVPTFDLAVPEILVAGDAATPFNGTLVSNDGATNVWVKTDITGSNADHVHVQYQDALGWHDLTDTDAVTPGQQLTFGDGDLDHDGKGFSVPAGVTNVTAFKIAADEDAEIGDVTWKSELVTGDAGTVLRSTSGTVAVDVPVAAQATATASAETLVYGKDVHVRGTLLDANHDNAPLAGRAVTVFSQVKGQEPAVFATTTTDAKGAFAVSGPAAASAKYWAVAGDQTTDAVEVRVAKRISSTVVNRKHATTKQDVRFTGIVLSPESDQVVKLQRQRKSGSWKTIISTTAKRNGAFKLSSKLAHGARTYRVAATAGHGVDGATSRSFVITVK